MTAWDVLIAGSTAPTGSDAWVHLNAQGGGGGNVFQYFGELLPSLEAADMEVVLEDDLTVELETEDNAVVLEDGDNVVEYCE